MTTTIRGFLFSICLLVALTAKSKTDSSRTKFIADIALLDVPANTENNALGFNQFSPSMAQSLSWGKSMAEAKQYYIKRLFFNPARKYTFGGNAWRFLGGMATNITVEYITSQWPLGFGWVHEEWHRAVMNHGNVRSYNDMNKFPIGQPLVSVSHETDADLAGFKLNSNSDFVRMSAAGIEAQLATVLALQKDNFYYDLKLNSQVFYWMNIYNTFGYVATCGTEAGDQQTIEEETLQGSDISKRDFTGLDLVGWIYDLSHPTEAYANRGVHPSGVGIRRYRRTTDLTTEELHYLQKMGGLQLLNFVSPHMFFINSIKINNNLRGNFGMFHYLTSFGYDAGINIMADYKKHFIFFGVHNYHNLHNSFWGVEAQLIDKPLRIASLNLLLSPEINVWSQPENQEFRTSKGQLGGRGELKVAMAGRVWRPYICLSGKTQGWARGDVYLDANFSFRVGVSALVK